MIIHHRNLADNNLLVVSPWFLLHMMIACRLANDNLFAVPTRSLRRPMIARPEALVWVASPGQA
jgi:hypothetical protein